jgi:hypothetical protein
MISWKQAMRQGWASGTAASLASLSVMALAGKLERNAPAGPLNGPSQWLFGRRAAYRRSASLKHTLTGLVIHHAMSMGWALLHERVFGRAKERQPPARRLRNAAITATVANIVDYKLTPRRLRPGFEAQVSRGALAAIYAAFAVGLAMAATKKHRKRLS